MAKDPAFLFYYSDFVVGTDDMTLAEVGAYIRCLCAQAARGTISEQHMKKICETHDVHMKVMSKFKIDSPGQFFNQRLREELDKRKAYTQSRRNNRLNNKELKKNNESHMNNISESYVQHMENENVNENKDVLEIQNKVSKNMNNNPNTKPAEQDEKPTAQELLFRGKLVSQLADNGYPVNMIDHAKHMAALLEFQKVYEAKEHRLYLERPFLDAVLKIYDEFKDKDYYTRILTTTRQYVEYCKRNNRLKKDAVKWLQEGMYMNDWTINDQPTEKKPAENQPEVFYTKKAKHPDAF